MMNIKRHILAAIVSLAVFAAISNSAIAQLPTGGPAAENPVWYHWIAGYPSNYVYITDDATYPYATPSSVPVVDTNTPLAWEDPTYWMDINEPATLTPPPSDTASWFIGSDGNPTTNEPSVTVLFTKDRDGNNGTKKVGGFAIGGGNAAQIQTLVISANMTVTGVESATNDPLTTPNRGVRIGRNDEVFDNQVPWGIVKQTHGLVFLEATNNSATGVQGDLRILADKDWISGGIWEVGGDARLRLNDALQLGDRQAAGATKGHGIFRVRGSAVQEVKVGNASLTSGDYITFSGPARGEAQLIDYGGGSMFHKLNGGKAITEFVLDQNGVTPIEVFDELRLGTNAQASFISGEPNPLLFAFLRVKLSAPTTKGSGALGSDDDLVLFRADRITSAITNLGGSQLEEGRFMDPDRDLTTFPHRPILEGGTVISNYAGATYTWKMNYHDDVTAPQGDDIIEDTIILSDLVITGTPGDLNGDTLVNTADRTALQNAIAAPPMTFQQLLGGAQHLYDLNADDVIDSLDLTAFNTYFLPATGTPGDFNNDGKVNAADYTIWRNNLNAPTDTAINNNGDGVPGINSGDYAIWKGNFGAGGLGAGGSGVVPEPATAAMLLVGLLGLACTRRRRIV